MFYFLTYCANCFLFNEGGEQCFTFQLIVSIVFVKVVCSVLLFNLLCKLFLWRWCAVFYFSTYCANCFCEDGVQCFTFQVIVQIVFVYWMWRAVFYFSTYCFNCFCLMVVVCSVLLSNLLFQLFLFNGGGEQCFTFQLIVSIAFV